MTARSGGSPRLPDGLSPAEEARWWDEHPEYWDTVESPDERIEPAPVRRTRQIALRLPADLIDRIEHEAARHALPYQTLIRRWLEDRLDAEARSYEPRSAPTNER